MWTIFPRKIVFQIVTVVAPLACIGMSSQYPLEADALAREKSRMIFKNACNAWTVSNMYLRRKSVQLGMGKALKKDLLPSWVMTSRGMLCQKERR